MGCMMERLSPTVHSMMKPSDSSAVERHPHGQVHVQVVDDHILLMTVDRVEKKNAFTPKIVDELSDALTRLDDDPDLFVGSVRCV